MPRDSLRGALLPSGALAPSGTAERRTAAAALLLAALALCACAPKALVVLTPDFAARAPSSVAVLPFDNLSNSLRAPELLRGLAAERLGGRGYAVKPVGETDEALRGIGLTDGGQLPAYKPAELAQALGVDGLFYGTVERFSYQNLGFFIQRAVELTMKLVEPKSGESLWEGVGEGVTFRIEIDKKDAGRAFVEGVAVQVVETAMGRPLAPESEVAVSRLLSSLPGR
jgi:hypothetical protein